jgi:hypothetical protein
MLPVGWSACSLLGRETVLRFLSYCRRKRPAYAVNLWCDKHEHAKDAGGRPQGDGVGPTYTAIPLADCCPGGGGLRDVAAY